MLFEFHVGLHSCQPQVPETHKRIHKRNKNMASNPHSLLPSSTEKIKKFTQYPPKNAIQNKITPQQQTINIITIKIKSFHKNNKIINFNKKTKYQFKKSKPHEQKTNTHIIY